MYSFESISLLQIEVFLTVAEQLNITASARKLFITQSAVSRWVQKLESSLGAPLFIRTNKGVKLTDEGRALYEEVKPLFSKLDLVLHNARKDAGTKDSIIRIGCPEFEELFEEIIVLVKQFGKIHPDISAQLKLYEIRELVDNLIRDDLDCIFTYSIGFRDLEGTTSKQFKIMDSYFAIPASFEAVHGSDLDASMLADKDLYLVSLSEMKNAEMRTVNVCKAYGFTPKRIKYVADKPSIEVAVKNGKGFTITGVDFGRYFKSEIDLFKIEKPLNEEQSMIAVWCPANITEQAKMLIEFILDSGSEHR